MKMWIKTRRSVCALIAIVGLIFLVYFLHDGEVAPVIHTIVIATKTKIHGATVEDDEAAATNVQKYLEMMGFGNTKASLVRSSSKQQGLVIATAALSRYYEHAFRFVKAFGGAFPNTSIVLFNLDLWHNEASKLEAHCNSTARCTLRSFELSPFPSHVRDLTTRAYKPLLMQLLLSEFCTVVWVDCNSPLLMPTSRFVSLVNDLTCSRLPVQTHAEATSKRRKRDDGQRTRQRRQAAGVGDSGLLGWTISLPTSALTQTSTFERLGEVAERFYFSRMLSTSHLVLYRRDCCTNTAPTRVEESDALRRTMLEWCRCVFDSRCLSPTGSQSAQCNLARVPSFKFSGCHLFEMSALNVALGAQYRYDAATYTLDSRLSIFEAFNSSKSARSHLVADAAVAATGTASASASVHETRMTAGNSRLANDDVQVESSADSDAPPTTGNGETLVRKLTRRAGFSLPFFEAYSEEIRWFSEAQAERQEDAEQYTTF